MHSYLVFVYMTRLPPRSTLFPTRRSSDLNVISTPAPTTTNGASIQIPSSMVYAVTLNPQLSCTQIGFIGDKDRKSTRLNSSHANISYAVFCLKKKKHL